MYARILIFTVCDGHSAAAYGLLLAKVSIISEMCK